jgi:hypothetical protein
LGENLRLAVVAVLEAGQRETYVQRLPTHRRDLVEVYAQEAPDKRLIPDDADFVMGFVVDDIREARRRCRRRESGQASRLGGGAFGDPPW